MRVASLLLTLSALGACGGPELYGACEAPADCEVPEGASAECLEKSDAGFCTWECGEDADCEEAPDGDYDFVCASFESEPGQYCFPSCEEAADEAEACPAGYGCRSTGGGSDNRKVCFPEG